MELDRPIGERIAVYRRRRNLSQAVLSGMIGRSESWLSQVERGTRSVDRLSVLIDIAKALHIDVMTITGQPFSLGPNGGPEFDKLDAIRTAMLDARLVDPAGGARDIDMDSLTEAVGELQTRYQAARYTSAGSMAPLLIRQGEQCAAIFTGDNRRRALQVLGAIYNATAALLIRVGETELASMAADRAVAAAQLAEDPELTAAGRYRLAHAFLRAGRTEDAHRIATFAAARIDTSPGTPEVISLQGALFLTGVIAASRADDRRDTISLLRQAELLAGRLGEDRNDYWTAFGPTNVRIHATSAAVEIGDPSDAVLQGERVDTSRLPAGLLARRSQVHIDLAWAYGQHRNDPATVLSLLEAERFAPEVLRYNVIARELLRECLRRERRTAVPGLRGLADRTGITG
jgi:transcriptional regulator with XRE-family HTH domain